MSDSLDESDSDELCAEPDAPAVNPPLYLAGVDDILDQEPRIVNADDVMPDEQAPRQELAHGGGVVQIRAVKALQDQDQEHS